MAAVETSRVGKRGTVVIPAKFRRLIPSPPPVLVASDNFLVSGRGDPSTCQVSQP